MYGGASYGDLGYSDAVYTPIDTSAFEAFLVEAMSRRCWLFELDALSLAVSGALSSEYGGAGYGSVGFSDAVGANAGGEITQRFSSQGYVTHAADTPAWTHYDPRLTGDITVERRIIGRAGVGGLARTDASVTLVNEDGALDTFTRDFASDGRQARLKVGRGANPATLEDSDALSLFGRLFTGVVDGTPAVGERAASFKLSDGMARLNVPLNPNSYAGTGNVEGGADLKGKPKPYAAGHVFNVPMPLVDSALLIYQAHDGAISDVRACYDRQIVLVQGADYASLADMNATAPAAGGYRVWKAGGYVRLGSAPAGTVTADVLGDASGAGYVNRTADIVLRVLVNQAALYSTEIDPSTFSNLNGDAGAEVGNWRGAEPCTCAQFIDELLFNVGAFGGFNRVNAFSVGLVRSTAGLPVDAVYTQADIVEVKLEALPAELDPVVWRTRVGWQKNFMVQSDVAAGVTAARRTFATEEVRVAKSDDASVLSRHRLAKDYEAGSGLYTLEADAITEASRQFNLWSSGRRLFRVTLKMPALVRELGRVVQIAYGRFGLAAGVPGLILGHKVKGSNVELLWLT